MSLWKISLICDNFIIQDFARVHSKRTTTIYGATYCFDQVKDLLYVELGTIVLVKSLTNRWQRHVKQWKYWVEIMKSLNPKLHWIAVMMMDIPKLSIFLYFNSQYSNFRELMRNKIWEKKWKIGHKKNWIKLLRYTTHVSI